MNRIKNIFLFLVGFSLNTTFGFPPQTIAKIDRSLWPYALNSENDFDAASKCEMLVFATVFKKFIVLNKEQLAIKLNMKISDKTEIVSWENATKKILLANFNALPAKSLLQHIPLQSAPTWQQINAVEIEKKLPEKLKKWYDASLVFYNNYLLEQYRLIAYSPRITSEIKKIDPNEILGNEFPDKQFLLTFDDGPTTIKGNTDKTLTMLNNLNISGIFFVLGQSLNNRLLATSKFKLQHLYKNHLVASHGNVHLSHQKYNKWQESISLTQDLIKSTFNYNKVYFRPPYGQRNTKITSFINNENSKIILWNLDSQDWNKNINALEVADRQITLMLLWRRGILLFHDVHAKSHIAVPIINDYFKNAAINWIKPSQKL